MSRTRRLGKVWLVFHVVFASCEVMGREVALFAHTKKMETAHKMATVRHDLNPFTSRAFIVPFLPYFLLFRINFLLVSVIFMTQFVVGSYERDCYCFGEERFQKYFGFMRR